MAFRQAFRQVLVLQQETPRYISRIDPFGKKIGEGLLLLQFQLSRAGSVTKITRSFHGPFKLVELEIDM